jgi:hypothetical protein
MVEPSLILLLVKTIAVFCLSTLAGWSLCYRALSNVPWVNWVIFTVVGVVWLNFVCIWAILLGFPGWTGLPLVALIFVIKLIVVFRRDPDVFSFFKKRAKEFLIPIVLLCSLSSVNYLAPLVVEGTSGYYSRGGGDHSTYLVFSEWFVENSLWDKSSPYEAIPPQRHWEAKNFVEVKSKFYPKATQPIANQLIATPFMSIFPGSNEETYSAAGAFYVSMACWSALALLFIILKKETLKWWAFAPLFLSNIIIYAATCQSIPYLLAISMINVALILYWLYVREPLWLANIQKYGHFFPLGLLHAGLLAIYPHGFVILMAFAVVMAISCGSWDGFKRYFILALTSTLFGMALVNFLLLTNIPLIFGGVKHADDLGSNEFHVLNTFASYSGVPDFLFWEPNMNQLQSGSFFGFAIFILLLVCSYKSFLSASRQARPLIISLFFIPWLAIAFFYYRNNGSYQIVRFVELGHLYLLVMAGFFFYSSSDKFPKQVVKVLSIFLFLIIPEIGMRSIAVKEVLSVDHVFATEFRDAKALMGVKKIETLQNHTKGVPANRIAYYFGPGDGVDFAGGSVLLRNLHSLPARGNTLASQFDVKLPDTKTRVWKKKWLDQAVLVLRMESDVDIIEDLRPGAFSKTILDSERLKIYDSMEQPLTQLVGDSWHTLKFYPNREDVNSHPFRYLKGAKASIVVWSQEKKNVNLSLFLNSDAPDSQVQIESKLFAEGMKTFNIPKWEHVVPESPTLQLELELSPGANILLLNSKRKEEPPPWLLFWKVKVS